MVTLTRSYHFDSLFHSQSTITQIWFLIFVIIRKAGNRRMWDETLIDLKKIDELATQIVLGGFLVELFREVSTNRNEERDEVNYG